MMRTRLMLCVAVMGCSVAVHASDRGTVQGEVRWTGHPRRVPQMARIAHDAACPKGLHPLVERRGKALAGVAVWLVSVARAHERYDGMPRPSDGPVEIHVEESGCLFAPRMAFVSPGAVVQVTNIDPQRHWLVVEGRHVKRRQVYHTHGTAGVQFTVAREDRVRLWSGLHRWMEAWIVAVETPWRAVTDDKGQFVFHDTPAGEYVLHAWHPALGEFTEVVSLPMQKALTVAFANAALQPDSALHLSIPHLRDEWIRPRGDRPYR